MQLPESVPEDLMTPLDDFWSLAVQKAEANYQIYKTDLETQLSHALAAQELATQETSELREEMESVRAALVDSETERDKHTLRLATREGENGVLREALARTQHQNEQTVTLLHTQAEKFDREKTDLAKKQAEALKYERERAEQTESRLLNDIGQLRQTIMILESDQSNKQRDIEALKNQNLETRQSVLLVRQDLENARKIAKEKENVHLVSIDILTAQIDTLSAQLSRSLEQSTHIQQELKHTLGSKRKIELANLDLEKRLKEATTLDSVRNFVLASMQSPFSDSEIST